MTGRRALFLDRDGVIIKRRPDYVKHVGEMEILPGVGKTIAALGDSGLQIIVVTNQSAINRHLMTSDDLQQIHAAMIGRLEEEGCSVSAIYYCPHRPDEGCDCRKPRPGLILHAVRDLSIDLSRSWLIGDDGTDIEAAEAAGCRSVMVETNNPASLARAAHRILKEERGHE